MTIAARHVALVLGCTIAVASCGGGADTAAPANTATPAGSNLSPVPPSLQTSSASAQLFEAIDLHASLAASPLYFVVADGGKPWTTSDCGNGGSLQSSLDGGAVVPGLSLPSGNHRYSVVFTNCVVDGLSAITVTGAAIADYVTSDWKTVTASVQVHSVRGTGLAFRSDLSDVTGEGSGTWTQTKVASSTAYTYAPDPGSRLVNNKTAGVATFQSGRYSRIELPPPPGSGAAARYVFDSIAVTVNDVPYVLEGSLDAVFSFVGSQASYAGEVRITSRGALVGRLYAGASGKLVIEEESGRFAPF